MNIAAVLKTSMALPLIALLALSGCGGGGGGGEGSVMTPGPTEPGSDADPASPDRCQSENPPEDCASIDPPTQGGDSRAAMALARAVAAAHAAASSLADAQAACAAVPTACQAAQEAAGAAAIAQSARQAAEAATTVAEVETAADSAEAAAQVAEEAAAEAKRLAGSEPPGNGGDNANWPEWPIDPVAARPMVGGVEIEDASSDMILAHLEAVANATTPYPFADVFWRGNLDWWHLPNVEFAPVMRSAGNVPLFQARTSDQSFPDSREAPEGLIGYGGWMDHSYFIMGLSTSDSSEFLYDPDNPKPFESTSDGYMYGVYDYFPSGSGDKFYAVDMHWLGAVVGTDKTLAIPNFVQGTVHMTIRDDARNDTRMDVDFKNLVNLTTGSIYHSMEWDRVWVAGRSFDSLQGSPEDARDFTLQGTFTGPNAEETVGEFDRDSLTGVFGAKRHTCIPTPCRH